MESIKLEIRRLGRIRNSEIKLTPWMVLSGDSGMGKSYLAVLVHYFFEVLLDTDRIDNFLKQQHLIYNEMIGSIHGAGVAFTVNHCCPLKVFVR